MFWFSYSVIRGRLVIMDVSAEQVRGVRYFTAAWSEDPRVAFTDVSPDSALARLVALHAAPSLRVTFFRPDSVVPGYGHASGGLPAAPPTHPTRVVA